jgi:hypothetical protein
MGSQYSTSFVHFCKVFYFVHSYICKVWLEFYEAKPFQPGYFFTFFILLNEGSIQQSRVENVFDVHMSKASERLKVVLLYLWRTIVKPFGGFLSISSADFCINKVAP